MPLKFRTNLSNTTNPNILLFDQSRRNQRNERNFSMKIEKLYSSTFTRQTLPETEAIYIGLENDNILGSESGVGLGTENQP